MSLSSLLNSLSDKSDNWSDFLLPSAINEAKQMVNSNSFRALFLFGVIAFLFMSLLLYNIPTSNDTGQFFFLLFSSIMDVGLILFIPLMIYQNMSFERSNGSFELMAITSITPLKIVLGKWQSGMLQCIIFGSIVTPGLIFSYFFDGVAISMIFVSLVLTIISAQFSILVSIFFCSLGVLKSTRLFLQVVTLLSSILILSFTIGFKKVLTYEDIALAKLFTTEFIIGFFMFLLVFLTVEILLIVISAAQLSPYSANKSSMPKLVFSILVLEIGLIFIFETASYDSFPFMILSLFVHAFFSFFFMMEKDLLSKKLFDQLQKKENILKQIWKKLFYPGVSSAFLLYLTQIAFLGFSFCFCLMNSSSTYFRGNNEFNLIGVISCFVFYFSAIYLTVGGLQALFPHITTSAKAFASVFVIMLIFIIPFILYLNFENADEMLLMSIFYHLTERNNGDINYLNLVITILFLTPALILAIFSNKRKVEEVRAFAAGERGSV